ncbi:MAG: hypothetical protein JHD16_01195 [Solirubrobacteraceae bacterium]|nr:hypothetical protein [Solirubrobacteraceae bacterium]
MTGVADRALQAVPVRRARTMHPSRRPMRAEPRVAIVVYDDDPQQLPLRRHLLLSAQRAVGADLGRYAGCEVVDCSSRTEVLTVVEHVDHAVAFIDLESRTGQMRGARLLRTIDDDPRLRARCTPVAMTAHNCFAVLAELGTCVTAVLQTTGEDLHGDACEALRHVTDPEAGGRRRAFPRAQTPVEVDRSIKHRFVEHFGFEPRPGDLYIVGNLAQGVSDSITNRELKDISGARSAVAHFKRAVKEARGVPVDLVVPLAQGFLAGCVRDTLTEPVRAGTVDLAVSALADERLLELARISDADIALVRRCGRVWHRALGALDSRDQAGRQLQVSRVLEASAPDDAERVRLLFLLHVLADLAHEPSQQASAALARVVPSAA